MTKSRPVSLAHKISSAAFALSLTLAGSAALAGSIVVAPGASGQIDVGDRYSYTTIDITNQGNAAGKIEVYDRYGRSVNGGSYITVTNTGAAPLHLISRYQMTYMTQ